MQVPLLEINLLLLPTNQLLQLAVGAAGSLTLPDDLRFVEGFALALCCQPRGPGPSGPLQEGFGALVP